MSRTFFYLGSLRKSIIQFLDIFNDLKIAKYDSNGTILKYVDVPIKYMPKMKFYIWLNKRKHEKRFPMIGVELTSIQYDAERAAGSNENIDVTLSEDNKTYTSMAVPYNLGFTLHIATEYQHEMDQINEQLLPFFNPFVATQINISDLDLKWDMIVNLEGAGIDTETDIDEANYRNVIWTHEYLAKTYMVKPSATINVVKKVVNKFYLSNNSWDNINNNTDMPSGVGSQDEELLVLGSKDENDEIVATYLLYGDNK